MKKEEEEGVCKEGSMRVSRDRGTQGQKKEAEC